MASASSISCTSQGNSEHKYHVSGVSQELQIWDHVRDKGLSATHHHKAPPTPRWRHLSLNQITIDPPKVHPVTVPGKGTQELLTWLMVLHIHMVLYMYIYVFAQKKHSKSKARVYMHCTNTHVQVAFSMSQKDNYYYCIDCPFTSDLYAHTWCSPSHWPHPLQWFCWGHREQWSSSNMPSHPAQSWEWCHAHCGRHRAAAQKYPLLRSLQWPEWPVSLELCQYRRPGDQRGSTGRRWGGEYVLNNMRNVHEHTLPCVGHGNEWADMESNMNVTFVSMTETIIYVHTCMYMCLSC